MSLNAAVCQFIQHEPKQVDARQLRLFCHVVSELYVYYFHFSHLM